MVSTVRTALTESAYGQLELKDKLRQSESISLSNNYSEISTSSILSEIEEKVNEEIRNQLLQRKIKVLRTLLSIRYMYSRMNQVPKSNTFGNQVISALPLDRFRHFFQMFKYVYLSKPPALPTSHFMLPRVITLPLTFMRVMADDFGVFYEGYSKFRPFEWL